jgi:hypothetical protein
VDGAGAKAPRLLWRKLSPFTGAMGLPADASGAYRPNPQATTKLAPRPSSRKGYPKILCLFEAFQQGFGDFQGRVGQGVFSTIGRGLSDVLLASSGHTDSSRPVFLIFTTEGLEMQTIYVIM